MAITLAAETQQLIERRMDQGGFPSADDLVRAALVTLDEQDSLRWIAGADLDRLFPNMSGKIAAGLAEADVGKLSDGEAFFAELEREERDVGVGR